MRSTRQAEHLAFARAERANIDAALAWSATHDPLLALAIVNGFGWAWIVLGDSRGAQRILAALDAAGDAAPARDRADALLLAAWIEASTGPPRARPRPHRRSAPSRCADDVDLQARCSYYLAYVVSHHGEFGQALELTDRSRALYDGLDRPWDQAANALFAARAAISAGDRARAVEARDQVEHWLRDGRRPVAARPPRRDARRAGPDPAPVRRRRRPHRPRRGDVGRLGFLQTEAYQVSSLGRAQCQAGDYDAGAATLELAIEKAEATGDVRLAALARVHLGRVLRALGRDRRRRATALEAAAAWHRAAGGGEQAALGDCLLAALDARRRPPRRDPRRGPPRDDAPVEVFALDALARCRRGRPPDGGRGALHHRARPRRPGADAPAMTEGRLAELTVALSLATDLGTGQPMEHGLRTTWLSLQVAKALGLDGAAQSCVYYVALLRFVGCTSDSSETAAMSGGDELAFNAAMAPILMASRGEATRHFVAHLAEGTPWPRRAGLVARAAR